MAVPYPIINDVPPRTQSIAGLNQFIYSTTWTASDESDILVYSRNPSVPANDISQLVSSSNYTVQFIGSDNIVQVTFNALENPPQYNIVTIVRNTPSDFLNNYTNTNFLPSMLNSDFDNVTLANQQTQLWSQIAPHYNYSEVINFPIDLILPILGANQFWAKNNTNTAFEALDVSEVSGAPTNSPFVIYQADTELPDAFNLATLANGILFQTVSGGVATPNTTPFPLAPQFGGTGVANGNLDTLTLNGPVSFLGTFAVNFTFTGITNLTFPTSGTLATTASASGIVNAGTINQLAYYAANGNAVSGLNTANNGVLVTDAGGIPSISSNLPSAVMLNITELGTQVQALSMGTNLIHGVVDPTSSQDAATKNYVDTVVAGLNPAESVQAASTTNLTSTYNNGTSGIGATLTNSGTQLAFAIDGYTASLNDRILIKNQSTQANNGVYVVTNLGSGSTNWVLTRATDFDTPANINASGIIPVINGTTNAGTGWLETSTVTTVGSSNIIFVQFGQTAGTIPVPHGGTGLSALTAYAIMAGGTTSNGAMQQLGLGSTGQLLQSNGPSALASYTTTTYPTTNAINTIMYASSANVLGVITPAANSVLISSAGNVPSWATTLPAGLTIPTPVIAQINDSNGNAIFQMNNNPSAVNYWAINNTATGNALQLAAFGSDTNISMLFKAKALGQFTFSTTATTNQVVYINNSINSTFNFSAASNRVYTFPDVAGTVTLLGNGTTGTGNFALANSPTFVTPVLGASSATSINFGGSSLSAYVEFTSSLPVITFATLGNLSVAYSTQLGRYTRVGDLVTYTFYVAFTPTYTTASGNLQISVPIANNSVAATGHAFVQSPTFPTGCTSLAIEIPGGGTNILLVASGSGTATALFTNTQFVSGTGYLIQGTISYLA